MKKKVCKQCKLFFDAPTCPVCKKNNPATSYQGRITILDANKSEISKAMGITLKGEYAIKVR